MNVKNDLLEELRTVSELVATISRETPYRVADDYFTDLASRVVLRIKTQHKPLAFNVPEGYFDGFAEGLLARIKAGAGAGLGADVREAAGPETANQEISAISPLLAQLRSIETYRMPEGYFEEVSPVLAIAKELNPFTVPEEYFHQLPVEMAQRVSEGSPIGTEIKKKAKLVPFAGRKTRLWQYSAAAVVAGLILTIGWLRLHVAGPHGGTSPDIPQRLAKVSDQELQNFLADQDTTLAQPTNNIAALEFNDGDVKSLLGDIPDRELKQYMDEHGGAIDIATN